MLLAASPLCCILDLVATLIPSPCDISFREIFISSLIRMIFKSIYLTHDIKIILQTKISKDLVEISVLTQFLS